MGLPPSAWVQTCFQWMPVHILYQYKENPVHVQEHAIRHGKCRKCYPTGAEQDTSEFREQVQSPTKWKRTRVIGMRTNLRPTISKNQ